MTKTKYYIAKSLDTLNLALRFAITIALVIAAAPIILIGLLLAVILLFLEDINSKARAWFALPDEEVDKNKEG